MVAVLAISWAGPLVRLASAPAVAVAAWRLLFTMVFLALILAWRGSLLGGARLRLRQWLLAVAAGAFLAGHFWTWFASIRYTSIAHAVVLVSTYPFWIAAFSVLFLGERPSAREWTGIGIAVAGTGVIAFGDVGGDSGPGGVALRGDLLAVLAAVLAAGYFTIGRDLRQGLDLWSYVALVYGAAAAILVTGTLLSPGVSLTGYPLRDWLLFLALAAGPMMLGHTGINYAIRYMPAYVANLAILAEAVVATLIAWLLPGIREVPSVQTLMGGGLVLLGIAVGTLRRSGPRRTPAEQPGSGGPREGAGA